LTKQVSALYLSGNERDRNQDPKKLGEPQSRVPDSWERKTRAQTQVLQTRPEQLETGERLNNNLQRALKKCRLFMGGPQWVGHLTPCEILAILDSGGRAVDGNEWRVEYAKRNKESGVSNPSWFYFYPGNKLTPRLTK
jgi:hypothetical protein